MPDVASGEAALFDTLHTRHLLGVQRGKWFRPEQVRVTGTVAATDQALLIRSLAPRSPGTLIYLAAATHPTTTDWVSVRRSEPPDRLAHL